MKPFSVNLTPCPFVNEATHDAANCGCCIVNEQAKTKLFREFTRYRGHLRKLDREEDEARFREIKIFYFTCVLLLCVGISLWMIATW